MLRNTFNLLGYAADPAFTDNSVDQLSKAQVLFDKGEFDDALVAAQRAHELDPESELAAVVLSSVHMAKAELTLLAWSRK